jgi:hypothetical protein
MPTIPKKKAVWVRGEGKRKRSVGCGFYALAVAAVTLLFLAKGMHLIPICVRGGKWGGLLGGRRKFLARPFVRTNGELAIEVVSSVPRNYQHCCGYIEMYERQLSDDIYRLGLGSGDDSAL